MGTYCDYYGRVGQIVDDVYSLFNDVKTGAHFMTQAEVLSWVNRCQDEIARRGYWKAITTIDVQAGVRDYELSTLITDLVSVHRVRFTNTELSEIYTERSWEGYSQRRKYYGAETGDADYVSALISGGYLRLARAPEANTSDALEIYYTRRPQRLGGGTEIVLTAAAVANISTGIVGLSASDHGLSAGEKITVSGTTNYNGTYTVNAATTEDRIAVAATYVAETLSAAAKCGRYYTPELPVVHDSVFVDFCLSQACLKDSGGRRSKLAQLYDARFVRGMNRLIGDATQGAFGTEPAR